MFREWRWWKQYHPSCEIIKIGELQISKFNNEYHMELKIEVRYTSRDNRHDTRMDISTILLDVYNTGKGRDSRPYRLVADNWTLKIHPIEEDNEGGFPVIGHVWTLPCEEIVILRYTFRGLIDALPLVDNSADCEIVAIGKAKVERVPRSKELKVDGKFPIMVDKKY